MHSKADEPRWRRRKTARPGEIVAAAVNVFADKGFAAARLEDVAVRAGVSKAALYLYFPTKADLFRAVVEQALAPNLRDLPGLAGTEAVSLEAAVRTLLMRIAEIGSGSRLPAVAKMVIGESRNFPDLAQVWHEAVAGQALGRLASLIAAAQARGEVKAGDPRLYAFSIVGPMVAGMLWREVFAPVGGEPVDLRVLAAQHAEMVLQGLRPAPGGAA